MTKKVKVQPLLAEHSSETAFKNPSPSGAFCPTPPRLPAKMYYIPIYLKCGIYVGYFSFYDFMWDTCGIDIFIVRICMWDKCGIGEKVKVF